MGRGQQKSIWTLQIWNLQRCASKLPFLTTFSSEWILNLTVCLSIPRTPHSNVSFRPVTTLQNNCLKSYEGFHWLSTRPFAIWSEKDDYREIAVCGDKTWPWEWKSWFHQSKLKAFATWQFYITLCCFGISRGEIQEEEEEDGFDDGGHGGVASWKHDLHALTSATSAKILGSQKVTSDDEREWGGHNTSTNYDVIYEQSLISWTIV